MHAANNTPRANYSALSPLRFLERSAAVFPDRVAIEHGARRYTYAEFGAAAQRLAKALAARIAPGDRVAFLAPNVPELLIAHFAVPLAGGVLVALNTRLAAHEVAYILEHSEAALLFADTELLETVDGVARLGGPAAGVPVVVVPDGEVPGAHEAAAAVVRSSGEGEGRELYADLLAGAPDGPDLPWGVDDEQTPITLNYTSGTTGKPKGVLYSHRGAYLNALGEAHHQGFDGSTRYLWTLPMFHCNGWCTPWAVTAAAGTHVCLRAVRADAVWDALDGGVTHLCGAPTVCSIIADAERAHELGAAGSVSLKITTAGAPPSPTIIRRLGDLGATVVHVYGLTEVYGPYTVCEYQTAWDSLSPDERAAKLSRQGVGMVQAETARVVEVGTGAELRDVPADGGTIGEIVLRGNNVMLGYYKDPEATERAFAGGWFHTGDLGVMHPDGYIQLKDRAKDIVISGGENISTIEVEQAIVSHPDVLDVAVIGMPDERWGERPVAFVVRGGASELTAEVLSAHVRGLLAGFKVPREIHFTDQLPKTSTGKTLKHELRALAAIAAEGAQ
ncbi:acyl-CoA synthetase [Sinomonas cyclohexanicum]|uniref:Acyl-CoA synthetase n=1 Tax=Sinomonas cyclohexanicum TaxID=322009 RepID=A0ABN6FN50_SINCY|nr:AMP-binding protein [Corynebacterium cyclohexanicum]BCT77217.1 acyl-CoA synthetase [Corynebacterium cyclohexanicum]